MIHLKFAQTCLEQNTESPFSTEIIPAAQGVQIMNRTRKDSKHDCMRSKKIEINSWGWKLFIIACADHIFQIVFHEKLNFFNILISFDSFLSDLPESREFTNRFCDCKFAIHKNVRKGKNASCACETSTIFLTRAFYYFVVPIAFSKQWQKKTGSKKNERKRQGKIF